MMTSTPYPELVGLNVYGSCYPFPDLRDVPMTFYHDLVATIPLRRWIHGPAAELRKARVR